MRPRAAEPAWHVALQPGATVLSPARDEVLGLDLEGRPRTYFVGGRTFKRSLASELFGRRTVAGVRARWRVPEAEAADLFARAAEVVAAALAEAMSAQPAARHPELGARLERALAWTPERLRAERERFLAAYAPISILPPDQYGAVVLQASLGCSWNRCTFCSFYQDRAFQVRPIADFEAHVAAVRDLLGRDADTR
ncbi:MAG: hypothetical protein K0A98_12250, partial [Trueperaceae bacterium]|nr:hypothetical protein [Trueperaceae bacterium]